MNAAKLGFFAPIFLVGSVILVPVLVPHTASADCGACVRDCDRCAFEGDLLRCGGCAGREYDGSAVPPLRDCDHCMSEFRCDLYRCAWTR